MVDTSEIIKLWLKLSTYNLAVGIYASLPLIIIPAVFKINAPYGRFAGKLGVDWSISGKWGWFVMEIISPIIYTTSIFITRPTGTRFQWVLISAWLIHYANRAIFHPLRATSMAPMHVLTFICSVFFNVLNGYTNGMWVGRHSYSTDLQFWCGMSLWLTGFVSNIYHDHILFQLRRQKKDDTKDQKRYFIPHGGLYEYISCPNYFSESIEWLGYCIASHGSAPSIIFVAATVANLFPRAWRTHAWYKNQFNNYPSKRKAIIPFLV